MNKLLDIRNILNRKHPLNRGLVGEWSVIPGLAGGKFLYDIVGRNHGTLINGPTWSSGRPGGFGSLNLASASNQHVNCGTSAELDITGSMTLGLWAKAVDWTLGDQQLIAKDKDTGGRAYTFDISGTTLRFYINGGGTSIATYDISTALTDGRWHWLVGRFDAGIHLALFIDGVMVSFDPGVESSIPVATANLLLGRREYAGFENPFNGSIDGAFIYNRALSDREIFNLYQESRAGNPHRYYWTHIEQLTGISYATRHLLMRNLLGTQLVLQYQQ